MIRDLLSALFDDKALASFCATTLDNFFTGLRAIALTKTVFVFTASFAGLVGSFHKFTSNIKHP